MGHLTVSLDALLLFAAQVDEGESQIINVRETDERLGPLVLVLVVLGCVSLVATALFWWFTRPNRELANVQPPATQGDL